MNARPSLVSANGLYLLSMLLVVGVGSLLQGWSLAWGLLATEVGFILTPTLVFLRRDGLPVRDTLQLRWPGWGPLVLAGLIGAGAWVVATVVEGVSATLLGYRPPSPLAGMPVDPLNLAVFAIALAVAAPVCEEVLFRGYLLNAYSRFRPGIALVIVSVLFACFHLRLQGLLALLPIAFALGYLTQRSRSLVPAIVAHAVNNGLSAGLTLALVLQPTLTASPVWPVALGGGMVIATLAAAAALWLFQRTTGAPSGPMPEARAATTRKASWPLVAAALVYVAFAGLEWVDGRNVNWLAEPGLRLDPAPWSQPLRLRYELRNVLDEGVGDADCTFTPQGEWVAFECLTRQRSFEARLGNSLYAGGRYTLRQAGHWRAADMGLIDAQFDFDGDYDDWTAALTTTVDGLHLNVDDAAPQTLPADTVVMAEWPWRMMTLPFGRTFYWGSGFTLVALKPGDGTGQGALGAAVIRGQESLSTADGPVLTWKVVLGSETAWYRVDRPHDLIRFNDGFGVTWVQRPLP